MTEDRKKIGTELRALIKAADRGEPDAGRKLREFADAHPNIYSIGDVHTLVMGRLIEKLGGDSLANVELISGLVDKRRNELGYAGAGLLERMLIERVVMCWLRLVLAEHYCNHVAIKSVTFKESDHAERNLTRASSRFAKATEALDRYRLMAQATRFAKAKADLIEARAEAVKARGRRDEEPQQPAALALVKDTA